MDQENFLNQSPTSFVEPQSAEPQAKVSNKYLWYSAACLFVDILVLLTAIGVLFADTVQSLRSAESINSPLTALLGVLALALPVTSSWLARKDRKLFTSVSASHRGANSFLSGLSVLGIFIGAILFIGFVSDFLFK